MKKIKVMILIISVILLIGITNVFAAQTSITMQGEDTVKPGETKKVTVRLNSESQIGVISGYIKSEGNIEITNVVGINAWSVTRNPETGKFNAVKAEGAKSEAVIEITYTASSQEGTGKIVMSGLEATSIEYKKETISDVSKQITVKKEGTSDTGKDNTGTGNSGKEESDKDNSGKQDSGKDKQDETTSKNGLSDTGLESTIVPMVIIITLAILSYVRYRKYKNI